jgi:hypothetical protein
VEYHDFQEMCEGLKQEAEEIIRENGNRRDELGLPERPFSREMPISE